MIAIKFLMQFPNSYTHTERDRERNSEGHTEFHMTLIHSVKKTHKMLEWSYAGICNSRNRWYVQTEGQTFHTLPAIQKKSLLCEKFSTFSVLLFPDSCASRTCECIMMTIKTQLKLHSLSISIMQQKGKKELHSKQTYRFPQQSRKI